MNSKEQREINRWKIRTKKLYTTEEVAMLVIIILSIVGAFMILRGW